jgi:hypothetical protein
MRIQTTTILPWKLKCQRLLIRAGAKSTVQGTIRQRLRAHLKRVCGRRIPFRVWHRRRMLWPGARRTSPRTAWTLGNCLMIPLQRRASLRAASAVSVVLPSPISTTVSVVRRDRSTLQAVSQRAEADLVSFLRLSVPPCHLHPRSWLDATKTRE